MSANIERTFRRAIAVARNRARTAQQQFSNSFADASRSFRSSQLSNWLPQSMRKDLPDSAWPKGLRNNIWASAGEFDVFRDIQDLPPSHSLIQGLRTNVPTTGLCLVLLGDSAESASHGGMSLADFEVLQRAIPDQTWLAVALEPALANSLQQLDLSESTSVVADPREPRQRAALLSLAKVVIVARRSDLEDVTNPPIPPSWQVLATCTATPIFEAAKASAVLNDSSVTSDSLISMGRRDRLELLAQTNRADGAPPLSKRAATIHERLSASLTVRQPHRLVVASHDLKFACHLLEELDRREVHVEIDQWAGHARHDERRSKDLLRDATSVFCEWTLGNARWYSHHIPNNVRLTSRFHMQERSVPFIDDLNWRALQALIFVADHARKEIERDHRVDLNRICTIPNTVEIPPYDFLNDPNDRFNLAMVGIVPVNKRFDVALDVLEIVRAVDPRYQLNVRGKMPDSYEWMKRRTNERAYFERVFKRIKDSPLLREGIKFVPFGDGLFEWYKRQGVVLSTSDFEAFHYSLPEGAVRGALPLSIAWPGADQTYPVEWLASDAQELAQKVLLSTQDAELWNESRRQAATYVTSRYESQRVASLLADVILNDQESSISN